MLNSTWITTFIDKSTYLQFFVHTNSYIYIQYLTYYFRCTIACAGQSCIKLFKYSHQKLTLKYKYARYSKIKKIFIFLFFYSETLLISFYLDNNSHGHHDYRHHHLISTSVLFIYLLLWLNHTLLRLNYFSDKDIYLYYSFIF